MLPQTLTESLLGPTESDADVVHRHFYSVCNPAVLKLQVITQLEQLLIARPKSLSTRHHRMPTFSQVHRSQRIRTVVYDLLRRITFVTSRRRILSHFLVSPGRAQNVLS